MSNAFDKDEFLSLFGIEPLLPQKNFAPVGRATVAIDPENSALRGLSVKIETDNNGKFSLLFKYKYYVSGYKPKETELVNVLFREDRDNDRVLVERAYVLGKRLGLKDSATVKHLAKMVSDAVHQVVEVDQWANPIEFLNDHRFNNIHPQRISKKLPGLYASGDFNTKQGGDLEPEQIEVAKTDPKKKSRRRKPKAIFPTLLLESIIGYDAEVVNKGEKNSHSLTVHSDDTADISSATLKYTHTQGKYNERDFDEEGVVTGRGDNKVEQESFYSLSIRAVPAREKRSQVTHLEFLGKKIDLDNQEAVQLVLETIGRINKTIKAGKTLLVEDLKHRATQRQKPLPMELLLHMGVFPHLNEDVFVPQKGLTTFRAPGGQNIKSYISKTDNGIGANKYEIEYKKPNKETENIDSQFLGIDQGVHFHEEFDVTFTDPSPNFHHKFDKAHVPDRPYDVLLITHKHQDHLAALPYAVKAGYEMPPVIMNSYSLLEFEREMKQLDVDPVLREQALSRCHIVNADDVNEENPEERIFTEIAGTTIEQWTEVNTNSETGEKVYSPRLKVGDFDVRIHNMPHSDPGLMFNVVTPTGSILHTGDINVDEDMNMPNSALETWVKAGRYDALTQDSTRADAKKEDPLESTVQNDLREVFQHAKGSRLIIPILGSNRTRMKTVLTALGEAKRQTVIIDGAAVETLIRDMNKIDDVKVWAREEYGLEILTSNQKRAKELIADKSQKENYALVVTGTQDEPYSSLNRAARDLLPAHRYSLSKSDVIVFSQGLIPVKDNAHRRKILQKTVQEFHGATVLLPETITQEALNHTIKGPNGALAIAASGHSGPKGKKWLLETSGAKTLIPIHGNKSQITAQAKMSENLGVEYLVLDGSTTVLVEKEKPVKKIGAFLSKTIGIKSHLPSPEQFYLKGHFTPIALAKLPLHPHPAAKLIGKFEAVTRRNAEVDSPFELKETLPASLSPIFNLTADTHGYMAQKIPFGIQKYPHSVLEEKGIFAIGAFDFETGGLNTNDHLAREYAMSVEDVDGNILEEVQIFQEIPTYRAPSPMALLVTNTNPYDLASGIEGNLNAQDFSQKMSESLKGVKDLSLAAALKKNPDAEYKKKDMKALVIAHNASFDSNVVVRELGRNLHMHRRPHQTRGVVTLDTKAVSRSLYAFSANGEYKVSYYDGTDIPNHKLESLCDMNDISYDQVAAHGGLEDTKPLKALYKKQQELSPDVVGQMVINADKSTGHLINDIRGTHNGFGDGPHPVFSYVSPFASRPKAQMGAYVGTFQSERFLIVMNLKYDPERILTLPPEDILKILQNGNDDRLELLDRNACPIIMPASFGLKVRANGSLTKGSLDARANMVKKHINYVDPKQDWKSLPNKLDKLYQEHWEDIYRARIVKAYLKTEKAMPQYGENVPTPEAGVRALLKLGISKFKPHHQEVVKRVRVYASAVQTGMKSEMTESYKNIRALRGHEVFERNSKISMDEVMDAVNNVHYDIRPADLSVKDAHRIEMMRHYMGYQHFKKAKEEILLLESDKDQYEQYIGDDKKKKAIFNKIKKWVKEESPKFELTDDVRAFIRPVRSITQPENDNSSTLKRSLA